MKKKRLERLARLSGTCRAKRFGLRFLFPPFPLSPFFSVFLNLHLPYAFIACLR